MDSFVQIAAEDSLVMTRQQVRDFDSWAINTAGIDGCVLMENAGRGCCQVIIQRLADIDSPSVCILCGGGNNGGDGFVIARHLTNASIKTTVVICSDVDRIAGDARINLDIIERMNIPIERIDMAAGHIAEQFVRHTTGSDMLIDAIFGTGLKGILRPDYIELIDSVVAANIPVIAVDIPSGLDCDSGQPLGSAVKAAATVTFVAVKKGFTLPCAKQYTGDIFVASIGIEPAMKNDV
jgi:NAD(P)H-hydrate epimerase